MPLLTTKIESAILRCRVSMSATAHELGADKGGALVPWLGERNHHDYRS